MINEKIIAESIEIARKNWRDWQDVFEHSGSVASNPIFAEPGDRFNAFHTEYSITRTIRKERHDDFRRCLIKRLPAAVRDQSGHGLDKLDEQLQVEFSSHDPPRSIRSFLSKSAAFVRPDQFVAWDQFAVKGLNLILGRPKSRKFTSYVEYLEKFDTVWSNQYRVKIVASLKRIGYRRDVEHKPCFQRRVLDVCFMTIGERKW